jgi:hypothetical protein
MTILNTTLLARMHEDYVKQYNTTGFLSMNLKGVTIMSSTMTEIAPLKKWSLDHLVEDEDGDFLWKYEHRISMFGVTFYSHTTIPLKPEA